MKPKIETHKVKKIMVYDRCTKVFANAIKHDFKTKNPTTR